MYGVSMKSQILDVKLYSDPGHGWAAVKRSVLDELKIADKISQYSYMQGGTVYLEEDSDLRILIDALTANGVGIRFHEKYTEGRSPIRNYFQYQA